MNEVIEVEKEEVAALADPDEHVLHMWTPFNLSLFHDYDYLARALPYRIGYVLLKALAVTVFTILNPLLFGFHIHGRKNLRGIKGAVTICNHIHPLDCTMVGLAAPFRKQYFVTLQSNLEIPFIRHLVKMLGGLPIPEKRVYMREFAADTKQALHDGKLVHIYPEGVLKPRWKGLRKFRNGAFSFAYDANVPIVPMVVLYRPPRGLYRLLHRKPLMELRVLPPVYPDTALPKHEQMATLKEQCRAAMQQAIDEQAQ